MKCPDCKCSIYQYMDGYDNVYACPNCRQLFDIDVFRDKRDV